MSAVAQNGGRGKRGWTSGWLYTGARGGWHGRQLTCQRTSEPDLGPRYSGVRTYLLIPARRRGVRRADVSYAVLCTSAPRARGRLRRSGSPLLGAAPANAYGDDTSSCGLHTAGDPTMLGYGMVLFIFTPAGRSCLLKCTVARSAAFGIFMSVCWLVRFLRARGTLTCTG
ncbi:hypothetical protein HYPSUDRAFT_251115 [Hypholoma sublateritium FD-334 SS-4]|uniref:Uncharacterized protein n=1 Tax=Hypholoma sublateritium (strain FD-334 SS-4) TaxID=945553 RepID=A0A0D2PP73_HYPSF|nr:hypothetical protein HYPSUDRAFT_251115 [Hypholoma sublateritium FD-334 SS-4]